MKLNSSLSTDQNAPKASPYHFRERQSHYNSWLVLPILNFKTTFPTVLLSMPPYPHAGFFAETWTHSKMLDLCIFHFLCLKNSCPKYHMAHSLVCFKFYWRMPLPPGAFLGYFKCYFKLLNTCTHTFPCFRFSIALCTGIPRFIVLPFIALHRECIFKNWRFAATLHCQMMFSIF